MTLLAAFLIVLLSSVATLAIMFAIRRMVPERLRGHEEHRGWIFAFAGVLYGLVVGFVLAFALDGYTGAEGEASAEADSVTALSRSATLFDAESRNAIGHELICYARAVIDDEWSRMRDGDTSELATAASDRLFNTYARLARTRPGSPGLENSLERIRELGEARAARLLKSGSSLPDIFWFFMVGGGFMLVAYAAALAGRETRLANFFFVVPVTILMLSAVYLVGVFDQPFDGPNRVQPDAMETSLVAVADFVPDPRADRPCP